MNTTNNFNFGTNKDYLDYLLYYILKTYYEEEPRKLLLNVNDFDKNKVNSLLYFYITTKYIMINGEINTLYEYFDLKFKYNSELDNIEIENYNYDDLLDNYGNLDYKKIRVINHNIQYSININYVVDIVKNYNKYLIYYKSYKLKDMIKSHESFELIKNNKEINLNEEKYYIGVLDEDEYPFNLTLKNR